jgi:hypothetical protein
MKIEECDSLLVSRMAGDGSPKRDSILETSEGIEEKINMQDRILVKKQPLILNMQALKEHF